MASLVSPLNNALQYSNQFDYPLTVDELWFWQMRTRKSKPQIISQYRRYRVGRSEYYALAGRRDLVPLRQHREQASIPKWSVARQTATRLSKIPTISAIFVTGALAMNNCPPNDDIDVMIITRPHTLWLTRMLVYLLLDGHRRPSRLPEHASPRVANTICDNLYLESTHLAIASQTLYHAHEVLQAKCVFDRSDVALQFLRQNAWVKQFLPVAYAESIKKCKDVKVVSNFKFQISNALLAPLNMLCYGVQFLYMKSKITHEKVSLHSAFFHPRQIPVK